MNRPTKIEQIWFRVIGEPIVILILRLSGTVLCVFLMTLLFRLFEPFVAVQYIALLFLLPVMVSTMFFGLSAGILAAFISFLAFNYYFIPPLNTLLVHRSQDLITLTIFLIVAIVISQLLGRSKKAVQIAREREHEAKCMYQLISALAGLTDVSSIARVLAEQTLSSLSVQQVEIIIYKWTDEPEIKKALPQPRVQNNLPNSVISMVTARNEEGEIRIWHKSAFISEAQLRILTTFSDQGALAIERAHLIKGENKSHILEESDKLKTSLLNSVSHELRSPLAAIKASVSSLRVGAVPWDSDARVELLTTVEEETDKLNLLVGNLLDMSRIEAGALNPQKKWNSIPEIVSSVVARMRSNLLDHTLVYNFPNDLPLVPSDFVMMEQVFTNLISNSVKYAPVHTKILISAEEQEEFILLKVTNQSSPVPEEHLEHIFDKFHRITQADKVTGTGLGLSICKGIIEAHGGRIWAENSKEGFCFLFTLPRKLNGAFPETPKDS